ncbi:hypothetical protein [Candidatus Thiothrix phosphatis]|uniref:hypothetical protein n=1 Tax=Candidatus Thiothrix phosphatis TaxID=3112415 RepID=UPI0035C88652
MASATTMNYSEKNPLHQVTYKSEKVQTARSPGNPPRKTPRQSTVTVIARVTDCPAATAPTVHAPVPGSYAPAAVA